MSRIQRVLISVTDKTGIVDFARELSAQGAEIISTGGTAKMIRDAGVAVRDVSEVTGFPEMLDGRVKTLHPKIAGGILAIRGNAAHMKALEEHGIAPIDMVVVNLYRFEDVAAKPGVTLEELIENIDIGGPTMIRAAAKNHQDVAVVVSPQDYAAILAELKANGGELSHEFKWNLARKAFRTTAEYDAAITARLAQVDTPAGPLPHELNLRAPKAMDLRYGENPHQSAALYGKKGKGIAGAEQLHGKELSYNNLVDLDAAWQLACEFPAPAVAIIKHTNPCGCAEQETLAEAYRKAFECDPVSAYGGVVAVNRPVDEETAREMAKTFLEAVAAPGYTPEALAILQGKKNLRLMRVEAAPDTLVVKSITGGFLVQTADDAVLERASAVVKSKRAPTEEEWRALEFGWRVAKHVKSNAIVYTRAGQTVGVGAGQMSRVDSVKLGAMKAVLPLEGTVVASDAFFPFADGVEEAAKHGVTAFIEPGGSIRDAEVIAAADRLGVAMVFTGIRHFRH
ncbi:MAG TPA: bifunctional phosphoribosylaminoimidazolecarboxamide formyltransferase/IMP cyclohydrolase [Candidatus Sulfopaludibacter sp.]|jgi:phosphoribosylaminoimidazolecarboxamide formyltransferase/IMP cyclohydrolase|nr:bifunctional phosphoribosylaminoimidazolecarboxamide formyltransferase/IMP cyclohydrolase [Candidatus Sulfopaludibacter sp.]